MTRRFVINLTLQNATHISLRYCNSGNVQPHPGTSRWPLNLSVQSSTRCQEPRTDADKRMLSDLTAKTSSSTFARETLEFYYLHNSRLGNFTNFLSCFLDRILNVYIFCVLWIFLYNFNVHTKSRKFYQNITLSINYLYLIKRYLSWN